MPVGADPGYNTSASALPLRCGSDGCAPKPPPGGAARLTFAAAPTA